MRWGTSLFEQAGSRAVSLQVGAVDHSHVRFAPRLRQGDEGAIEHPQVAPAHEVIVQGLVGTAVLGRIPPTHAVADHEDNPRQHPPIVYPRHAVRQWKERLAPSHLLVRRPQNITHRRLLIP